MCKKIKIAMITNHLGITGIGTVIMNYCMALDRSKYDITIMAGVPISAQYEKDCQTHGVKIISLPSRHDATRSHYLAMWKALRKGHYDIVHVHGSSSLMAIDLTLAKVAGVKNRIAHSHNSTCTHMKLHKALKPFLLKSCTARFACSRFAGEWLFGANNFRVIPNGFTTEKFRFSTEARQRIRSELNISDQYVLGHIGRLNDQKNQILLIDIFEQYAVEDLNAILLLVGDGPNFDRIQEKVEHSPYKNRIILYGETTCAEALYAAMDIFLFPSLYEGLGIVLLEAQINGLPCIASDAVPSDVVISNWIRFLPIGKENIPLWIDKIKAFQQVTIARTQAFEINYEKIKQYDIGHHAKVLDGLYGELL